MNLGRGNNSAHSKLSGAEPSLCLLQLDFPGACLQFALRMCTAVLFATLDALWLPAIPP